MTVVIGDHEHDLVERLVRATALVAHEPGVCQICDQLNLRRTLDGLADQIEAARKINATPHQHGPKPKPKPQPKPQSDPPSPAPEPPKDGAR